jgi:hypothetical protein
MQIKVVDDSMGSFKSSSAIKMMHESRDKSWVVVTPYLDEIDIFKNPIDPKYNREFLNLSKTIKFHDPTQIGWGKLQSLKELLIMKKSIATTHALFKYADEELIEIIKANDYTLVLDEVMEIIQPINLKKRDIERLIDDGIISISEIGVVSYNEGAEYYSRYEDIISTIKTGRVVSTGESFLLWCFPIDVLKAFSNIYVLTYMFEHSLMKAYLDTFGTEYEYLSVDKESYSFKEYREPDISKYKDKVEIIDINSLNNIGNSKYALSFNWYGSPKNRSLVKILKTNLYNYYRYTMKCKSSDFLWTTFKDSRKNLQSNGYRSDKTFCPCNARATNIYANKTVAAYMVNRFVNPMLVKWFKFKGVSIDQDMYALSELVQWIFRSSIRKNNKITLYIPSKRMRELLINWLNQDNQRKQNEIHNTNNR